MNDIKFRWLGTKKGFFCCLLAVWQPLQSHWERFPNPTALLEPLGGTAPSQVGSTHLRRNHSNLQNLAEALGGGSTHSGPGGLYPCPCPRGTHQPALPLQQLSASPSSSGSFTAILICSVYQLWLFKAIRDLHQESLNIEVILCKLLPLLQQEGREKPFFF